jgi:hypothetical protein
MAEVPMYELCILGDSDSPHDAIRSLLHTTLTHMAEFEIRMLGVISKKFGHTVEELVEAIRDAPEFATKTLAVEVVKAEIVEKVVPQEKNEVKEVKKALKTKTGKKVVIKSAQGGS